MDAPLTEFSGRVPPRSSPLSLTSLPLSTPMHSSALSLPMTPPPLPSSSPPSSRRLDALLREQAFLSSIKSSVPNIWSMVETEIMRMKGHYSDQSSIPSRLLHHHHSHILPHGLQSAHQQKQPPQNQLSMQQQQQPASHNLTSQLPQGSRKRIKLRVPAEKYPDYNFVGRLLGPRGATLKKLERDTGCKIMIRGRGSIRKDKESEVRGKPGWEHVFNETLHVVIEVSDAIDEADATRILTRAKECVELLLVPVPEERDTLKRQQLRDLAILNGTYRASDGPTVSGLGGSSSMAYQAHPSRAAHMIPSARDFGISGSTVTHPNMDSLAPSDSLLSRRRTAPSSNNINLSSSHLASNPSPLSRHNMDAGDHYSRNQINNSAGKGPLPSRSDTYLPDIGSLHIPSLEIETMSENFLVSPILGHHGLPGPSPTIVDPDMYPFPSTPSVTGDHPAAFGSPIWSGPQHSSVLLPSSSPPPVASSPLPSPPQRSPRADMEGSTTTPSHSSALPAIILTNDGTEGSPVGSTQKFGSRGEGLGLSFNMAKGGFQAQHVRGGRELPKRGNLFDNLGSDSGGDDRSFGSTAFANYFPKVTGEKKSNSHGK